MDDGPDDRRIIPTIARTLDPRRWRSRPAWPIMQRTLSIALTAAICGGVAGGVAGLVSHGDSSTPAAAQTPALTQPAQAAGSAKAVPTAAETYRRDAPGVVVITATETKKVAPTFFTPPSTEKVQSLGSGFVIDRHGDIVTNDHVVAGASGIRVGFTGGSTFPAKVVGADPSSDLAVVRVRAPSSALHPLTFDNSGAMQAGDPVYAIGNPFGLDRTMTAGIVSATGRDIQAPNGLTIPNAIQTDAPINHGNSGGPLLDGSGRVVGVNAQIEGGTVDANVGVGFAIPSDAARSVAQQLIANGRVEHSWIGVQVETIPPGMSTLVRGMPPQGVAIARVVGGSPAARAGLRPATHRVTADGETALLGGDSIVGIDGKPIHTAVQLADVVARHKPGDRISVEAVRGGHSRVVQVTLGSTPPST
jgi:S1-C subfamily serine protease